MLTLSPALVTSDIPPFLCLLCSDRALADALANVILFLPLGLLLNLNGLGIRGALLAALALSGSIEALQVLIPGRFPDFSDVLTNGGGGVLGVVLGRRPDRWIRPSSPWRPRLFLVALTLATLLPFVAGFLLGPIVPEGRLWSQWAPRMPHLESWDGRVLDVDLGGSPLPHAVPLSPDQVVSLQDGGQFRVRGVSGAPPAGLAPVLRIVDDGGTEGRLLAIRGADLVWFTRNRARVLLLDSPGIRWEGILDGMAPGQPLFLAVDHGRAGICMQVAEQQACGMGLHAGRAWAFLQSGSWLSEDAQRRLDHLWIGGVLLLVGFWTPPGRWLAPWVGLLLPLLALGVSGAMASLVAVPGSAFLAGALGWLLGWTAGAGRLPGLLPERPIRGPLERS